MKYLSVLALLATTCAAVADGTSYDISGTTLGASDSTYIPMGDTHMFVSLDSKYTLPENGTPMAGMTGECMGNLLATIGAGATGSGACIWTDADGDTWFGPWDIVGVNADRASLGTWYVSGGTGKFAMAAGGGTFTSLTNPANGESKLDVFGAVTMQ